MTPFSFRTEVSGGRVWVTAAGELDLVAAPDLEHELRRIIGSGSDAEIVLDLRAVPFVDSSGLRAVLLGATQARDAGRRLAVLTGDGQVRRTIELARVDEHLELADPETLT